jgi:cytochrome c-type biogenesis protein CcmH
VTRLLVILAALTSVAATPQVTLPDIEDEVMCVACGTALNISQAPSADAEREFIRNRIAEGLSKEEIKEALVAEYGPKVLAEPRQSSAWIIPVLIALAALVAVALSVRRWRDATSDDAAPPLADADALRLEQDMKLHGQ